MSVYEFADFRLDSQERTFFQNNQPIQLAPKVFDTLVALVSRHGRLVSKEALMEEIWRDCFVEENNLTQYIFTLRRALGEKKDGAKFIETVPRKGYRFTAEVRVREFSDFENVKKAIHDTPSNIHTTNPVSYIERFNNENYARGKNRLKRFSAYGLIVLLMAISLGFGLWYDGRQNLPPLKSKELKFKRLTESGNLSGAAISPDGNLLAYVAIEDKKHSIRLRNIQSESEVTIITPGEELIGSPRFSPDGNFIYYTQARLQDKSIIYRIPVLGGEPRKIAEEPWSDFSISPDGREIAFPRKDTAAKKHYIVITAADGNSERIAAERSDPDFYPLWGPAPAWSPDGKRLTVVSGQFGAEENRLIEINLADGSVREIEMQDQWAYIDSIGWAGKDELIIAARKKGEEKEQLWRLTFPGGASERLTNDFNGYEKLNLTRDASRLVVLKVVENLHLWHFDRQTNATRQLTSGESRVDGRFGLALAPDGGIIFTARSKKEYDIFSINPDNGEMRQLTKTAGRNTHPAVSPDNRLIVFTSERSGAPRLWLMNRDGSEARQLTPASDDKQIAELTPRFSPDGKWVYYAVFRNSQSSIYKISLEGGEPVEILPPDREPFEPVLSPDGKLLVFGAHDDRAKQPWFVSILSLADGKETSFNFPAFRLRTRWMPDSESLVSIEQCIDGANLWRTNLKTGERRQITNFNTERIYHFDVSADGRFFVLSRGNFYYDAVLIER